MAQVSSGSFNTTGYGGRYLTLSWSISSTSITNNYKDIKWELKGAGGATNTYYYAGAFKVVIDGETVFSSSDRIQLFNGTVVASGTKRLYHNNIGNKSFSASAEAGIYTYAVNCKGSGSWELPTIPRYATSVQELSSKDETNITMNWSSDNEIDFLWYSTDNGSNWTAIGEVSGKDGQYTITGLEADTDYKIKTRVKRKDSQLTTDSSALTVTTYDYPHITNVGVPNLIIGYTQTLTIYNPLSRNVTINMLKDSADGSQLYTGSTSDTSISFKPTATLLYDTIPNSKSGKAVYSCTFSTISKRTTTGDYTYVVDEAHCKPTFSNFTYKDSNTTVTGVTGNDQVLVKGKSNLQVTISSANKMVTTNSASPSKYVATIDTLNKSVNYSTSDITLDVGTVINSGNKRLNVTAYDSRTLFTTAYKDITVYDYVKPVVNVSVSRLNNFEAQTTLKVNGEYTRLTIDGTDKNSITKVQYRYREAGGSWSSWTTINTTLTAGKFTCTDVILTLDNTKSFEIEVQAIDKLDSNVATGSIDVGEAIFFISTNKKACYINGELIKLGYREPAKLVNGDYNTMCGTESGFFRSTSVTNAPYTQAGQTETSNWFYITQVAHSESYLMQIAIPYFEDGFYYRINKSGTWSEWKKLAEASELGTLSNLETSNKNNIVESINELNSIITEDAKVLWGADRTEGYYMNASQTASLTEKVSEQKTGIVLVFCCYDGIGETNWNWQTFFIPKNSVSAIGSSGFAFLLNKSKFYQIGSKYLYINDDSIVGHVDNTATGTSNGITYANNKFVLRYVIGV